MLTTGPPGRSIRPTIWWGALHELLDLSPAGVDDLLPRLEFDVGETERVEPLVQRGRRLGECLDQPNQGGCSMSDGRGARDRTQFTCSGASATTRSASST